MAKLLQWKYVSDQTTKCWTIPHRIDNIRLRQLYCDATASYLVASISRFPVIVLSVAVDQRVTITADTFDEQSTRQKKWDIVLRY